jgi:hypothetical protein
MRKLGTKMPKSGNATIDEEKKPEDGGRWWLYQRDVYLQVTRKANPIHQLLNFSDFLDPKG